MISLLIWVLVILFLGLGFLSCFINKIPGPILVFIGILIAQMGLEQGPGWGPVAIVAVIAIVAFILSKMITRATKKMQEYSKITSFATTIASLIGVAIVVGSGSESVASIIVWLIIGFVVLPFLFALLVESIRQKSAALGVKSAIAATVVYLTDTALKLAAFAYAINALITMS
ncbi:MAG: DUF456 family protein [Sodaliphilus sp.]